MSYSCLSQAKHANGEHSWGINGETGKIEDMKKYGLYESAGVKVSGYASSRRCDIAGRDRLLWPHGVP